MSRLALYILVFYMDNNLKLLMAKPIIDIFESEGINDYIIVYIDNLLYDYFSSYGLNYEANSEDVARILRAIIDYMDTFNIVINDIRNRILSN